MRMSDRILFREAPHNPVPDGTQVQIRRISDNYLIGTTTTSNGYFSFQSDGYEGAAYWQATVGAETLSHSSLSVGPALGVQLGEMEETLSILDDGIISGVGGELIITPKPPGLRVTVAAGAAFSDGLTYRQYGPVDITFAPIAPFNAETNAYPVAVRFHGDASATPWRTELVHSNTPTLSPPAGARDLIIGRATIAPGATALTAGDIWNNPDRAGTVTTDEIPDFESATWTLLKARMQAGSGLTRTIDEGAKTISYGAPDAGVIDAEAVMDIVAAFLKAGTNITLVHDDPGNTLTISSSGGGSGGAPYDFKDANFLDNQGVHGLRSLNMNGAGSASATATVSLPAGTWFIDTQTHFNLFSSGNGVMNTRLTGNGTPQGDQQSSRNFPYSPGWRQIILTGRRKGLVLASTTNVSATAQVAAVSGTASSVGSGVVFIKAYRM